MKHYCVAALCVISSFLYGQTAELYLISNAGGDFKAENQNLTYSFGEVITETFSTNNLILTQGFVQPQSTTVNNKLNLNTELAVNIYPNPAKHVFIVDIDNNNKHKHRHISYELFIIDLFGRTIQKQSIKNQITEINISNFLPGIYAVRVTQELIGFDKTFLLKKVN